MDRYQQPARMTSPGRYQELLGPVLSRDLAGLAAVGHGLIVHEHLAGAYGVTLSDEQRSSVHVRPVEEILECVIASDDRPLGVVRDPASRVAGNCRQFTVLMITALRAAGIPARARCGFGGYFGTAVFEDHWVCEYWNAESGAWALVDSQLDERQRELFAIDFDVTDVPRDRFLVAGRAWALCRTGAMRPEQFGLSVTGETGSWWIAGNLMRDAAALLNLELLPWDSWGAMPGPDDLIDDELAAGLDRLALYTQAPDDHLAELELVVHTDDRFTVPAKVYNTVRDRFETV